MKFLLLKHYRGPKTSMNDVPMDQWTKDEVDAHMAFMADFTEKLKANGEFVDATALREEGDWVRYDGVGNPPIVEPLGETKDLIAGWYIIDVESKERAYELAGELSSEPGAGGRPLGEWLEVRPLY